MTSKYLHTGTTRIQYPIEGVVVTPFSKSLSAIYTEYLGSKPKTISKQVYEVVDSGETKPIYHIKDDLAHIHACFGLAHNIYQFMDNCLAPTTFAGRCEVDLIMSHLEYYRHQLGLIVLGYLEIKNSNIAQNSQELEAFGLMARAYSLDQFKPVVEELLAGFKFLSEVQGSNELNTSTLESLSAQILKSGIATLFAGKVDVKSTNAQDLFGMVSQFAKGNPTGSTQTSAGQKPIARYGSDGPIH